MASILNTDLRGLIDQWNVRVAEKADRAIFDAAYEDGRISSIERAGRAAGAGGLDSGAAFETYKERQALQDAEQEFPRGEGIQGDGEFIVDDVGEVDDVDEAGYSIYFDEGGCSMEYSMEAENAAYNKWCDSLNARRGRL